MKNILSSGGKLFLICAVAALLLGGVDTITAPVIKERKILELKKALAALTPDAEAGEASEVTGNAVIKTSYPVLKENETAGYILELIGVGYGDIMKILARFDPDGTIKAVKLMDNLETPGLGKKAEGPSYMNKFIGTGGVSRPVPVRKDRLERKDADAVTGATITFLGIAKALREGASFIRKGEAKNAP